MSTLRHLNHTILNATTTVGASATNQPITKVFAISQMDSERITIDIIYADAVVATGITAKLQSSFDDTSGIWVDHGTVAITGAVATTTRKTIDLNIHRAADQASLPLRAKARVVVTSGAGDSVTIGSVYVSRRTAS